MSPPPESNERRRAIGVMSYQYGPDYSLLGRARHQKLLSELFAELDPEPYGADISNAIFFLTVDGRFSGGRLKNPIRDRTRRCNRDDEGTAYVDIGLSLETIRRPEEEFREVLSGLLLGGAVDLVRYARKRGLDFDATRYTLDVAGVIERYRETELPLPPTRDELRTAASYGIPVDAIEDDPTER